MKLALLFSLLLSSAALAAGTDDLAGQPSCQPSPQSPGMFQLSCGSKVIGPVGDQQTCMMMGQMLCPQFPGTPGTSR